MRSESGRRKLGEGELFISVKSKGIQESRESVGEMNAVRMRGGTGGRSMTHIAL